MHSPFVFGLVTRCFYDKKPHAAYEVIENYRKKMLQNRNSINITDFGAGSKVFSSDERKIAAIAWNSGITPKRGRLMNRLVRYLNIKNALELGTSVGIGSVSMVAGNDVKLTTIEGCPETAKVAEKGFKQFELDNINLKVGKFEPVLEEITKNADKNPLFDMVFIDGNHQKEATLAYFEKLLPVLHNDSVVIFDDIHWSRGMEEAWSAIIEHPKVSVTIDTFFQGFVFFRKEQRKEHFVIRV
ncbi:O-methyltransferase [Salinimicrobium sp. GXAS 041]|uniref:O-methyltransferase n=1 Tax=Salinimicrobium sp. GXAS 041 TaxID=3400806 RepID=UPI003C78834C